MNYAPTVLLLFYQVPMLDLLLWSPVHLPKNAMTLITDIVQKLLIVETLNLGQPLNKMRGIYCRFQFNKIRLINYENSNFSALKSDTEEVPQNLCRFVWKNEKLYMVNELKYRILYRWNLLCTTFYLHLIRFVVYILGFIVQILYIFSEKRHFALFLPGACARIALSRVRALCRLSTVQWANYVL